MTATRPPRRRAPAAAPARTGWRRGEDERDEASSFGARLRAIREARRLSLAEASAVTGLPGATLSRIENSRMSPTLGVILKLMRGLKIEWRDLMHGSAAPTAGGFISFSADQPPETVVLPKVRYEMPHGGVTPAPLMPFTVEVANATPEEVGGLAGHPGFEFCLVLDGVLDLHVEGHPPRRMQPGESALFDSSLPHAYARAGARPARVLIVSTRAAGAAKSGAEVVELRREHTGSS